MIWKCPICDNEEKSKYVCRKCGYDTRKDFVQWRTVSHVPEEDVKERLALFSDDKGRERENSQTAVFAPKKSIKKWIIAVAALLCAAVLGMTLLGGSDDQVPNKNMLMTWAYDSDYVMGTEIEKTNIQTITFLDFLENMPKDAWDVSANHDGSVMAWIKDGNSLYFAANGAVIAYPDSSGLFSRYQNLEEINFNQVFDTSQVTNMSYMFYWCKSLESLNLSGFDTSQVTDMSSMFDGCKSLRSLDLSGFDTSQVTDMEEMFSWCERLESLDLSGFDTSQVTDMRAMFSQCERLENLDVSGFDTSQVMDMQDMFFGCESLESLNLSGFDTSQVTDMSSMFDYCESLRSLDLSGFDTSQVTDMSWMFSQCKSLENLDVGGFDMSQVESSKGMFACCDSLSPEVYEGIRDGN